MKINKYKILLLLTFMFLVYKAYYVYIYLINNSIPVYDSVIYEKNQIIRYLNFRQNFSLIEKYNQIIYEFSGNHVSAIFNIICIIINPKLLINDVDIFARGIIAISILFLSIHQFVNQQIKISVLILLGISSLPTLFHYRFGIFAYIPDLISGLFLLSAYIYSLTYLRIKNVKNLLYAIILIFLAIGFRFNFFVFSGIVFFPIGLIIIKSVLNNKNYKSNKLLFFLISVISIGLIFYVYFNFNAFIDYYGRDAKYAEISLNSSFNSFLEYLINEINILFIVSLLIINSILNNCFYDSNIKVKNSLLLYPFIALAFFLVFYMKATNQPHVFSVLFLFLIPIAFTKNNLLVFGEKVNKKYFIYTILILNIVINLICFKNKIVNIKESEIDNSGILLANKIDKITNYTTEKKYFLLFESALEIPLDVYFFKKYNTLYENKLKYYYTDFEYYSIDKKLNYERILSHYITEIQNDKPELIILNSKNLNLGKDKSLGNKINIGLRNYVQKSKNYKYNSSMKYKNQKILFYKLNKNI